MDSECDPDQLSRIEAKLDRVIHWIDGNGHPGAKLRLAMLEERDQRRSRIEWLILAAAVGLIVVEVLRFIGVNHTIGA